MPLRIFLVGTDTDCGKTTLACALVRAGWAAGLRILPFKPAASGPRGPTGDPERLAAAAPLGLRADEICPLRYPDPVAPGVADDPARFTAGPPLALDGANMSVPTGLFGPVLRALQKLERSTRADVTLIEGAGGLFVPMPGGTWQPAWISGLAAAPVVVARLGLGTVNHTLLTVAALRRLGMPPRGLFLVETIRAADPSIAHNPAIVTAATGLPLLGVLPHGAPPADWLAGDAWARLRAVG